MFATGAVVVDLNPAGAGWNVIAASDIDRDGRQDLAVASTGNSVVQVLYNRASGWAASPQVPVAASPRGIAIADLNRNGTIEIVVAGRAASLVTVITRSASGALSTADFAAGTGARAVAIADFQHDGRPDIATANEFGDSATVLHNTMQLPRAGFAFDGDEKAPLFDFATFDVADFNHNGRLDVVRSDSVQLDDGTVSRRMGRGTAGTTVCFLATARGDSQTVRRRRSPASPVGWRGPTSTAMDAPMSSCSGEWTFRPRLRSRCGSGAATERSRGRRT
jgi:hypothetical protein